MPAKAINVERAVKTAIPELLRSLSATEQGLSSAEAADRLRQYGPNEIVGKKVNSLLKFLSYFWGPIPWMIEVAAILSAIIDHWADFWVIFAMLLLNAVVGFWQEHKADNAIELLKEKLALKARVRRDGAWREVEARELVPGDIARVRLGDIIPADVKLIEGDYVLVDESTLTGESLPVEKHSSDVGYSGAIIRQGEMNALVVGTGMNTFFGKTARLVEGVKSLSHFHKAVIKIGDYLILLAAGLVAVIFMAALFRHESMLMTLQFALVLTVAAIPVALPAVLSVTMAVGAVALSKKKAIVSKLAAIEEIAGMDILCSDKTGTITRNDLTITDVQPLPGSTADDVLLLGALASREEDQDPIDNVIIAQTKTRGDLVERLKTYKIKDFKPFDPVIKRVEAGVEDADGYGFRVAKGAPQVILSLCYDRDTIGAEVDKTVKDFAIKGYRTLGVAKTDVDGKWRLAGIIPIYDPPREDSAETLKTAQSMGVDVKMVTGDHTAIAKEISREIKLGTNIIPAADLLTKSDREARLLIEKVDGFSQVFPEHKYHIVELLQEKGHIVGMTGDGVNDAPALKKADTGIAVAGATDAAKSAADIVLTLPGLSVIIDAIKESRKIFRRMNSYAIYRIAETIRVLFFITLSILVFNFYPVTAIMIVLIALLNDAPIMAIAYDHVRYSKKPAQWQMRRVLGMATIIGTVGVFSSFGIFYIGQEVLHLSREMTQSFIFLKLAVAGHLTIFLTRTPGPFWSSRPGPALLWSAVITKLIATLVAVYGWYITPIGWNLALFVWGYALIAFVITDFIKVRCYRLLDHQGMRFHNNRRKFGATSS